MIRAFVPFLLLALGAGSFVSLDRALAMRAAWPREADSLYLPSSRALRALSLGHTELAADLVAARANVYFGTMVLAQTPPRHLARYMATAVDLDPGFGQLYARGAAMMVYNGQPLTVDMLLAANALLERGIAAFPFDWELRFQLGFNLLFELPGLAGEDDARVPGWRQQGVESLRQAALFEGAPPWAPALVARMLTKRGADELAIRHLEQAYAVASSEEARAHIRLKLQALRGQHASERLDEEQRELEQMLESRYPYAPEAFSIIAGPRRPRWIDLDRR